MKVQRLLEFLHAKWIGVVVGLFFSQRPSFLLCVTQPCASGLECRVIQDVHQRLQSRFGVLARYGIAHAFELGLPEEEMLAGVVLKTQLGSGQRAAGCILNETMLEP